MPSRINIIPTVYHLPADSQAAQYGTPYGYWIEDGCPALVHFLRLTEEWQEMPTRWVERPGMVVVENMPLFPPRKYTRPSVEETRLLEAAVIEILFTRETAMLVLSRAPPASLLSEVLLIPHLHVKNGRDCRFSPTGKVYLRCRSGVCRCKITVLPD